MPDGERSATPDPLAAYAPFHDLDLGGFEDDLPFWLGLAEGRGSVLELGCGGGRVAAPLAAAGLRVAGADVSASMLALARRRAAGLPLRLVEGDMRSLRLGERFGAVFVPLGGLQHLETAEDVAAAFATIAAHLAPGGVAAVDVEAPHPDDWLPGPRPLVEHWTRPLPADCASGPGLVTKLVAVDGRPAEQRRLVAYHFDAQPEAGPLRRTTARFALRVVTAGEIELAARLAGLRVAARYGDWDGSPPDDGDDRIVAVLERGEDGAGGAGGGARGGGA